MAQETSSITKKATSTTTSSSENTITETVCIETIKPSVPAFTTRTQLPSRSKGGGSLWSVLKKCVGKDLTRVSVPLTFNEPLSLLQRISEYMEYVSLIKQALKAKDAVKRMELVATFALSTFASNSSRLTKPFNPLLYETYELSKPELGFEFVAEQVSHHPPISAFYARGVGGDEFEFYGNIEPRIKFWGRSLEDIPISTFTLHLKPFNEKYTWEGISCSVHNLYMGKMYIALNGTMNIKCQATDLQTEIRFAGANKGSTDTLLYGEIIQRKNPIRVLYGNWTEYIASTPIGVYQDFKHQWKKEYHKIEKNGNTDLIALFPDSKLLWRVHSKPPNSKDYYNMTYFSMMLNEKVSDPTKIPRTDTRFRPDIRLMEDGNIDSAQTEKERLESKQRGKAKARTSETTEPLWFSLKKEETGDKTSFYAFNGNYWNRSFSKCDDIY